MKRFAIKLVIVIITACVGIVIAESALFHYVGQRGWNSQGPDGTFDAQMWFIRFGGLPADTETIVMAPVMEVNGSRSRELRPVLGPNGLVNYFLSGGFRVPMWPQVQHALQWVYTGNEVRYFPTVRGFAGLSSDEVLWCRVLVALPYEFRAREFVGTVDDFPPPPTDSRWHTTQVDLIGFGHNVVLCMLLFGWLFFLRELRDGCRFLFSRRHTRMRHGLCGACGYDLRELETPRCPECGSLRDGTAGMWNRQRIYRAIAIAVLALTLAVPAYASLANAPSWTSPGSIWVIAPLLMSESRAAALITPAGLFVMCASPVLLWPSIGRKLVPALLALLLVLTAVFFFALWSDAAQWWGTGQFFVMLGVNALCATACTVLWLRQYRSGTFASSIAIIYCIWLWMTWAGFPLLYELP